MREARSVEFTDVTELAGSKISAEQLERMSHRYHWALLFCRGKDVVEVACGSGQGLGLLAAVARSLEAGDYSAQILDGARSHYGNRVHLEQIDAESLPYRDSSKDVIILFEAIYYLPHTSRFVAECRRVLRPGGQVLIATANKDLWDFNPSPLSHRYYGATELTELFAAGGFNAQIYGHLPGRKVSLRQRLLRPAKKIAVQCGLMPRTAKGKLWLKRLIFGNLVEMPAELTLQAGDIVVPTPLPNNEADHTHKVLYCCATLSA
jgi:ubiquinone/menaquinone biosynthesis C-methylase UbiE